VKELTMMRIEQPKRRIPRWPVIALALPLICRVRRARKKSRMSVLGFGVFAFAGPEGRHADPYHDADDGNAWLNAKPAGAEMRFVLVALAAFPLVTAVTVHADGNCMGAKLAALAKEEARLLACQASVASRNDTSALATCEAEASSLFFTAFGKAGVCLGDGARCDARAYICESTVSSVLTDAFPSKCEAAKRKAAGKLANKELGCYARAARRGVAVDPSCLTKARSGFGAAMSRAGTCPDGGFPVDKVEGDCVQPAVLIGGTGIVADVCSTTATTTTTTTLPPCNTSPGSPCDPSCPDSACFQHVDYEESCIDQSSISLVEPCAVDGACGSGKICISVPVVLGEAEVCASPCPPFSCLTSRAPSCGGSCPSGQVCAQSADGSCTCGCDQALPCPVVTTWGSAGSANGQFKGPGGIAVDGRGNVYVADSGNDRVESFTSTGILSNGWGGTGSGDGQFSYPRGVAVDASGNVFVADVGNDRIQKFTSSGTFLTTWGNQGSGDGQFDLPIDVAVDDAGNVFVADEANKRIQKFNDAGTFVTKWGSPGSGDGQFSYLLGIAVDASGNVFVADTGNDRIQKFDNTGAFLTKWGSTGSEDGQFYHPSSVAVDRNGNVFVTDTAGSGNSVIGNSRIQEFTDSGTFVRKWGCPGNRDGQFNLPLAVGVDASGNVFVADTLNDRIQEFACH
jgi:streptogramin lyase